MQSIAPTPVLLGTLSLEIAIAVFGAWLFRRFGWSNRRSASVAAAPIPAAIVVLCLWVFIDAATSSKESCGVDACGMAMAAAVGLTGAAFVLYLIGLGIASLAVWIAASRKPRSSGEGYQ